MRHQQQMGLEKEVGGGQDRSREPGRVRHQQQMGLEKEVGGQPCLDPNARQNVPEQLRLRTLEEREEDRVLARDLRLAATNLYPEVGGSNPHQKNFLDITSADYPPGSTPPVAGLEADPIIKFWGRI